MWEAAERSTLKSTGPNVIMSGKVGSVGLVRPRAKLLQNLTVLTPLLLDVIENESGKGWFS